jgi:hypothetical protein
MTQDNMKGITQEHHLHNMAKQRLAELSGAIIVWGAELSLATSLVI